MKKIISIIFMIQFMTQYVYAASTCNVNILTSKNEYNKNEEIVVEVKITNIQSNNGIITFGATLDYDTNSLIIDKIEGQNGWSNPSYNELNGLLVMDRNDLTKNDETIMKITFKIKENYKENVTILLKEISIGDGDVPTAIEDASKLITIKDNSTNITPSNPENNGNNNNNNNNGSINDNNNNGNNGNAETNGDNLTTKLPTNQNTTVKENTTSKNVIPKTGISNVFFIIIIFIVLMLIIGISYIKIKKIKD